MKVRQKRKQQLKQRLLKPTHHLQRQYFKTTDSHSTKTSQSTPLTESKELTPSKTQQDSNVNQDAIKIMT